MKKVFLVFMSLMLIMCLAGCNTINKDDFECIIDVDKTNVKVGETIKIRAFIKNNINIVYKIPIIANPLLFIQFSLIYSPINFFNILRF